MKPKIQSSEEYEKYIKEKFKELTMIDWDACPHHLVDFKEAFWAGYELGAKEAYSEGVADGHQEARESW